MLRRRAYAVVKHVAVASLDKHTDEDGWSDCVPQKRLFGRKHSVDDQFARYTEQWTDQTV